MRHQNTVFHDILKRVPWGKFDALVARHEADKHVRRVTTKKHLIAMLYAQFSGAESLRAVELGLTSQAARLYHVGGCQTPRSTLADANATRPAAVFEALFSHIATCTQGKARREAKEALYLIDASTLPLSGNGAQWATFSTKAAGAKMHVVYDTHGEAPIYASVTPARTNDITAAKDMPITPKATYVFDLGYYDYGWWAKLDQAECRLVTRLKKNTRLHAAYDLPLPEETAETRGPGDGVLISDRVGYLPARQARNRKNPFSKKVREVTVKIPTGKRLRIVSNDLEASAREIANLYKRRWDIELFFRWVKQTLKIRKFLGRNENAVRIQVAVALIAYLLLKLAHQAQDNVKTFLGFVRLVGVNLMEKRRLDRLLKPPDPLKSDQKQGKLNLSLAA